MNFYATNIYATFMLKTCHIAGPKRIVAAIFHRHLAVFSRKMSQLFLNVFLYEFEVVGISFHATSVEMKFIVFMSHMDLQ